MFIVSSSELVNGSLSVHVISFLHRHLQHYGIAAFVCAEQRCVSLQYRKAPSIEKLVIINYSPHPTSGGLEILRECFPHEYLSLGIHCITLFIFDGHLKNFLIYHSLIWETGRHFVCWHSRVHVLSLPTS